MTAICRTCLEEISEDSVTFYLDSTDSKPATITVRCKLAHCVPEMDLDVVPNAAICDSCVERLKLAHEFKNKCLETEGRIQSYIEQMGYVLTCIDLRDIVEQSKFFEVGSSFMGPATSSLFFSNKNSSQEVEPTIYDSNRNPISTPLFDDKPEEPKEKSLDIKNLQCDTQNFFAVPKIAQLLASNENSFKCRQCAYTTSSDLDLRSHEKNHSSLKLHKCSECDYSAPKRQTLIIHMRKHNRGKLYNCNDCGYGTPYRNTFVQHVRSHVGERPYNDFSLACSGSLGKHIRTHAGEKLYKCGLCSYRGRLKFDLKAHMLVHIGEKPYKCLLCDYASSHKTNLSYHMRIHTGEKPYRCKLCEYTSSHRRNLQNHMRMHTEGKSFKCGCSCKSPTTCTKIHLGEKLKQFSCSFCNYSCSTKINFIKHVTVHSGEKPFKCFNCEYTTKTKIDLEQHLKAHAGEKPYICITCQTTFDSVESLTQHMKHHMPDSEGTPSASDSTNTLSTDCAASDTSLRVGCENEMII